METGYNGNGRPVLGIEQKRNHSDSWQEVEYTLHTPDGTYKGLTSEEGVDVIHSYKNPVLDIDKKISGKAKRHFREQSNKSPSIPWEFVYQEV